MTLVNLIAIVIACLLSVLDANEDVAVAVIFPRCSNTSCACTYPEFQCDSDRHILSLNFLPITHIPTQIGLLSHLQSFSLYNLTGNIPTQAGRLLNLTFFNIQDSRLNSRLPTQIGRLTKLQFLGITSVYLTGTLPTQLNLLTELTILQVSHNRLNGTIPDLSALINLHSLFLSNNFLHGGLPRLPENLQTVWLSNNRLQGSLDNLGNKTQMQSLSMSYNQLSGSLPDLPPTLIMLDATSNLLSGSIPGSLYSALNLSYLTLGRNQLSGAVRIWPNLKYLDLSYNLYANLSEWDSRYFTPLALTKLTLNVAANRLSDLLRVNSFAGPSYAITDPQDHDECQTGDYVCPEYSICTNGWAPILSYTCTCQSGYTMLNSICVDIDECATGDWAQNKSCLNVNQCVNVPGSFWCCSPGYANLAGVCADINECLTDNMCEPNRCLNTPGSYHCCPDGYYNPDIIAGDECISCYNEPRVLINPEVRYESLRGYNQSFDYRKCFGSCDQGQRFVSITSKCDADKLDTEPCSLACTNITEVTSTDGSLQTLLTELSRGGFAADVLYRIYSVNTTMEITPDGLRMDVSPCDVQDSMKVLILNLSREILPQADIDVRVVNCSMVITVAVGNTYLHYLLPGIIAFVMLVIISGLAILYYHRRSRVYLLPGDIAWSYNQYELQGYAWDYSGNSKTGYHYLTVDPSHKFFARVTALINASLPIREVTLVHNRTLLDNFLGTYLVQKARYRDAPELFQGKSWLRSPNRDAHQWVNDGYTRLIRQYPWNQDGEVTILPMFHGTDLSLAQKICETGFATLSKLDAGWYGKGIYFTNAMTYCLPYITSKSEPCIIVSWVLPGNTYPVIESSGSSASLSGSALKAGYQSHFVLTDAKGHCVSGVQDTRTEIYNELVVNQEAQIVPAFLLHLQTDDLSSAIRDWSAEVSRCK